MTRAPTKISQLRAAAAREDWREALRLAAGFQRLGTERGAILAAWEAMQRPAFQRQLGRDPEQLITAGIAALKARYRLEGAEAGTAAPNAAQHRQAAAKPRRSAPAGGRAALVASFRKAAQEYKAWRRQLAAVGVPACVRCGEPAERRGTSSLPCCEYCSKKLSH